MTLDQGLTESERIKITQKLVTTRMNDPNGKIIQIRKCSEPTNQFPQIFKTLKYKPKPSKQKKFVVPQGPPYELQYQQLLKLSSE